MEFTEAESNLIDLISEYEQYETAGMDDDEELVEGEYLDEGQATLEPAGEQSEEY